MSVSIDRRNRLLREIEMESPESEIAISNAEDDNLLAAFLRRGNSMDGGVGGHEKIRAEFESAAPPEDSECPTHETDAKPEGAEPAHPQKKLKSKLALSKAKEFTIPQEPQDPLPKPGAQSSQQPSNYGLPVYHITPRVEPPSGGAQSSYVVPFFSNDDEIAQNRIFNNVVSKMASAKLPSSTEVIDPTPFYGTLKYFDERNNFGFLSTVVAGIPEDIFAYRSEFEERVQGHPVFGNPRAGKHLIFEFNICSYFGKYKKSKKAMNIRVAQGL